MQLNYGENLVNIARQHLEQLSRDRGRNYIIAEEALSKIRSFKGNLKNLPRILENAIIFTENLLFDNDKEDIVIQPYSLDFESFQVDDKKELSTRKIDSRESRAMQLLDKLERAAMSLKSKNMPLISSKVGQEMDPPISAPAITDALRKNRTFVRQLIEKYPDKWETIRNNFKPLLNQLKRNEEELTKEESA
jgi:hypothetical protein